ncbi:MAG: 2-oxo acid dehydrogenase subunit E2 [Acidobacteria bacterium]|nr:2-oxo acid dehydrogenase subunit E2 [Acidobacteriota bacterium]
MVHDTVAVRLPFETVNDASVTVLEWLVDDGERVEAERPLVLLETTKTVVDVPAPVAGVVCRVAPAGAELPVGAVLCHIGPSLDAAVRAAAEPAPVGVVPPVVPSSERAASDGVRERAVSAAVSIGAGEPDGSPRAPRLSAAARALAEALAVAPAAFAGRLLVRERDVRERVAGSSTVLDESRTSAAPRTELGSGLGVHEAPATATTGSVTVAVPSDGRLLIADDRSASTSLGAVLVFECARLLVRYPDLNASWQAGVHRHASIDIGYLMDFAASPPVSVIRGADRKDLETIGDEYVKAVRAYLRGEGPSDAAAPTFTIADLSTAGVVDAQPVVGRAQSAALAVSAMTPAWPGSGFFHLVLAFDARIVSGRAAAAFLEELRDRLVAHEQARPAVDTAGTVEPECALCLRPMSELEGARHMLVRTLVGVGRGEQLVCTICLRDWCA